MSFARRSKRRKIRVGQDYTLDHPPRCPSCREILNGATGLIVDGREDRGPRPGSVTLCTHCGEFLEFTEELDLRALTVEEVKEKDGAADDPRLPVLLKMRESIIKGDVPEALRPVPKWPS